MTIEHFIENFAEQLDNTSVELLTPDTDFRMLDDWSSLTALAIIAMVDEVYGVTIAADEFKASKTIEDLFNHICKQL